MSFDNPCPCCLYYTLRCLGAYEQCPCCGWTDSGYYNDDGGVWIDEAQRNFGAFGACARKWLDSVTPPSPELRRAPPPMTIDEWKDGLRVQFIDRARVVFAKAERPRHFTSLHCDECIDHDEEMQPYDNDTLPMATIENPMWNPLCFLTAKGFRYFMPGLLRLQIQALQKELSKTSGWLFLDLIDVHLCKPESEQFALFAPDEIQLVADFYAELLRCPGFHAYFVDRSATSIRESAQGWLARSERASRMKQEPRCPT